MCSLWLRMGAPRLAATAAFTPACSPCSAADLSGVTKTIPQFLSDRFQFETYMTGQRQLEGCH
jgi:hypothetical protein